MAQGVSERRLISILGFAGSIVLAVLVAFFTNVGEMVAVGVFGAVATSPWSIFIDQFGVTPFVFLATIAMSGKRKRSAVRLTVTLMTLIVATLLFEQYIGREKPSTYLVQFMVALVLAVGTFFGLSKLMNWRPKVAGQAALIGVAVGGCVASLIVGTNWLAVVMWLAVCAISTNRFISFARIEVKNVSGPKFFKFAAAGLILGCAVDWFAAMLAM